MNASNILEASAQDSTSTNTRVVKKWQRDNVLDFDVHFQPGVGYSYYSPKASDSLGNFSGMVIEYLIWAGVRQNEDRGPSHTRVYAKINLLKSDKSGVSDMFMYGGGLNFSFERNPKRGYLIPYFGVELGGISQSKVGSTFQITPLLGAHLVARKNIFVNLHGGYVYPVNDFEKLQGYFAQLGVTFSFW
jgi:hypothetical protein